MHYNNVSKVAVFGCLNPVFGAILSALILKESGQSFGIKEVIALVLISGGIFIVGCLWRSEFYGSSIIDY